MSRKLLYEAKIFAAYVPSKGAILLGNSSAIFARIPRFRCDGEKCCFASRRKNRKYHSAIRRSLFSSYIVPMVAHTTRIPLTDTAGTYRDDGIIKARNPEMMKM